MCIRDSVDQGVEDLLFVAVAEGLQRHPQFHAALTVDVDKLVVLQLDDIAALPGHDGGDLQQLAGAVGKLHREGEDAPAVQQAVLDQGGDGDPVHIAPGQDRHHVLALTVQVVQGGDGHPVSYTHLASGSLSCYSY